MALFLRRAMGLAVFTLLFSVTSFADQDLSHQASSADETVVYNGYIALNPAQANSKAFMDIQNKGLQTHQIIGAKTPIATQVKIVSDLGAYNNSNDETPIPLQYVSIPRNGYGYFRPGYNYFLLLGTNRNSFREGQNVPFTLFFADGSSSEITVPVLANNQLVIGSAPGNFYGPTYGYGPRNFLAPSLFFPLSQAAGRR